jgi:hypothetical protein
MALAAIQQALPQQPTVTSLLKGDRDYRVRAAREYDGKHAVLIVREAPRIGARLSDSDGFSLRRYLVNREQVYRAPTGKIVFATDHFLLDSASEPQQERQSTVYNFRIPLIHTSSESGRLPRVYSYAGHLLFTDIEPTVLSEWQSAWDTYLRASLSVQGAERRERDMPYIAELYYRDQIRRGYLLSQSIDANSLNLTSASLVFSMFVIHQATLDSTPTFVGPASTASLNAPQQPFQQTTITRLSIPGEFGA